jgi:hypothetical protein
MLFFLFNVDSRINYTFLNRAWSLFDILLHVESLFSDGWSLDRSELPEDVAKAELREEGAETADCTGY